MGTTASADRRDPSAPRRTIKTTVDLTPGDERDTWQADSIDMSPRGMAMRASVLPEVGESLGVRFHPEGGAPVSARAEVVWATDQGHHAGTFGVRFTDLSPQVERALRRMLDAKDDGMVAEAPAPPPADTRVKLHIHGMDAPLRARVRASNASEVVVGSELSFLKLGDKVDVDGAGAKVTGSIVKVDIEVDARTRVPRLILSIDLGGRRKPDLGTAPTVLAEGLQGAEVDLPSHSAPTKPVKTAVLCEGDDTAVPSPARGRAAQGTHGLGAEASPADTSAERSPSEAELSLIEPAPGWITQGMKAVRRVGERAVPVMRCAAGAVGQLVQRVRDRRRLEANDDVGPVVAPRRGLRPQHPTQRATASVSEEGDALGTQPGRPRKVGLYALVGVIVVAGIVAYASTSGPKVETPRPQVAVAAEGAGDSTAASSTTGDSTAAAPGTEEEPAAPSQPEPRMVQGRPPRTVDLAAAASTQGELEAPVIQASQPRAPRPQAPRLGLQPATPPLHPNPQRLATAPPVHTQPPRGQATLAQRPAVPSAVPQRPLAQAGSGSNAAHPAPVVFGNPAVRNGTVLRLRMDGPITAIQGVGARGATIVMTVPGRHSLDMAAPLAQVDPRIAGAGVMNRATGAELTLRFREPAPPFVARSRGNVLEIVLAPTPGQALHAGVRVPSAGRSR